MREGVDLHREFFRGAAMLQQSGRAGPGERVMGYLFRSPEEAMERVADFQIRMQAIRAEVRAGRPVDASPEYVAACPRGVVMLGQDQKSVMVITQGLEPHGAALRTLGRPMFQTLVALG